MPSLKPIPLQSGLSRFLRESFLTSDVLSLMSKSWNRCHWLAFGFPSGQIWWNEIFTNHYIMIGGTIHQIRILQIKCSLKLILCRNNDTLVKVAGGVDFIKRTLSAFSTPTSKQTFLVDMYGYDAYPALACIEDCAWTMYDRINRWELFSHWCSKVLTLGWLFFQNELLSKFPV